MWPRRWADLPEEIWKQVLGLLRLKDRMTCSRVCSKLHRAAAAATTSVEVNLYAGRSFSRWYEQHGQHLTSLKCSVLEGLQLRRLPCPGLKQLHLSGMDIQLGASSSHPGVLQSCSNLTELHLVCTKLLDSPVDSGLAALVALTGLENLKLSQSGWDISRAWQGLPPHVLQGLTKLTRLQLNATLATESLQHISALTSLQQLYVSDALAFSRGSKISLTPASTPGIAQIPNLRVVHLALVRLDPSLLLPYSKQLEELVLVDVDIIAGPEDGDSMPLLTLLAKLKQLRVLELCNVSAQWPAPSEAYAAITASSKLQRLELRSFWVPQGIWQYVFTSGRKLPDLHSLTMPWTNHHGQEPDQDGMPQQLVNAANQIAGLDADAISSMVSCCPGLQRLYLRAQRDMQLTALTALQHLTGLGVEGVGDATLKSLAALTGLRVLDLWISSPVSLGAYLTLTALTSLTELAPFIRDSAGRFDGDSVISADLTSNVTDGPPDVWLQVLESCADTGKCGALIARGLGQQLADQSQRMAAQQEQLRAADARAAALEGRVKSLESQVQQLLAHMQRVPGLLQ